MWLTSARTDDRRNVEINMQSNQPIQSARLSTQQKIELLLQRIIEEQKVAKLKAVIEAKLKTN